ncbi:MAG: hypothetical protein AM325_001280 [Candidatus Thorarchaeota archaeon SMTZ1-45]
MEEREFLRKSFHPNESLTITTNTTGTTTLWDFPIDSDFEINSIDFSGEFFEYSDWTD